MNGSNVNIGGNSSYYFINWSLSSQNIAGNYSTISWACYYHFNNNDAQLDNGSAVLGGATRWSNGGRVYNYAGNFTTRNLGIASGSFNLGHNNDGTKTLSVSGSIAVYASGTSSGSSSWSLPNIPRHATLNSAQNFNDTQNPVINYSNPAGTAVDFYIETPSLGGGTGMAARSLGSGGGGNYTVTLTTAERNELLSRTPNSKTITARFVIHDSLGGSNSWSYKDYTMTVVSGEPTFSDTQITYEDTNTATLAVTGNNQQIVQNISNLEVTFTGATANKYATIASYKLTLATDIQTVTSPTTIDYATVNLAVDTPVQIEVTDSRGFKTTVQKTITILPWNLPSAVNTVGRVNNYEDTTGVKSDVTIASVGGNNAIEDLKVRYKKTTDVSYTEAALTTGVNTNLTLDKLYEWNIEIVITDKFGTTTYTMLLGKGIPIVFFDTALLSMGIGVFPTQSESLEVDDGYLVEIIKKIYPVGFVITETTATNPGALPQFAGTTWTSYATNQWQRTA